MKTAMLVPRADLSSRPTSNCSELAPKCEECGVAAPSLLCRAKGAAWNKYMCNTCRMLEDAGIEQRTRASADVCRYTAALAADALKTCVTPDHDKCWISRANAERRVERINKLIRHVLSDIEKLEQFRA